MYWIYSILMIAGICFDLFATMEVEGSMLPKIKPKKFLALSGIVLIWQIGFFVGGYYACLLSVKNHLLSTDFGTKLAFVIALIGLALLGVRLIIKAIKKENIEEKRKDVPVSKYVKGIVITTFFTLFAGCAQGLMTGNILFLVIWLAVCSFAVTILGLLVGYRIGNGPKPWIYGFGAGLLWASALIILVEQIS